MKTPIGLLCLFSLLMAMLSCEEPVAPKKIGYYRIDLPEKNYEPVEDIPFPFEFELPQYAKVNLKRTKNEPNFFNIDFPKFTARLHMSFLPVDSNINQLLEDSRELVFKHTIKAQDIKEKIYQDPARDVYGILYSITGNAASPSQFFLTDSNNYFLRGALYFSVDPNPDSLAPVSEFIKEDIQHLIESFNWRRAQKDLP